MFMKIKANLDFDEFVTKVGEVQMGILSNQTEFDKIYQLCFATSFFPLEV